MILFSEIFPVLSVLQEFCILLFGRAQGRVRTPQNRTEIRINTAQNKIRKPQTVWFCKTAIPQLKLKVPAKPHQKSTKTAPQTYAALINGFVSSGFFLGVWVKMPRKWNWNQTCFLIMVTGLVIYVCLHILHPHRKNYVKELSNVLLTDPLLTWRCRSI